MVEPTDDEVLNDPEIKAWFQATTERKEAGLNTTSNAMNSSDFDSGFKKEATENTAKTDAEKPKETPSPVITEDKAKASAMTATALMNVVQDTVLNLVMRTKMDKRFGQHVELLEAIADKADNDLSPEHLNLRNRYVKYLNKDLDIRSKIPFSAKEKDNFTDMMKEYFKATGKELSPNLIIAAAVLDAMVGRVNRIMFDLK
jgi:hypothetical protein